MSSLSRWDDLAPRLMSAAVMLAVGALAVALGGLPFLILCALIGAGMVWELSRMIAPQEKGLALALAAAAALAVLLARLAPGGTGLAMLLLPSVLGGWRLPRNRAVFAAFALAIGLATFGLSHFRDASGPGIILWLLLVVIATDVFGYFAGKSLGGPKFWPAVSPKKTWSGTAAGWLAAGAVGFVFSLLTPAGPGLVLLSMLVSFAGQMGDIAESAVKRRLGVKDSSNLIPGHGGLFDRFDAILGATLFMLLISLFVSVPQVSP
ncbi:Phosphatidate cytidylyltransferase [Pseudoruegeria aquimaris]|uniref:Phosphatidate cytidylyltransferase n=1 Tax=Pseudoruegeria aquimaris TaxID=393663 RepID=A0A1Y5S822_9RHOB|nr:phosphatidate cytidylyltransferase [Pseudoruegeria aquimaris]SLN34580.1 Phosphatidate cytidylyltransferase [Pseudoruegeria aquimaris]